MVPLYYPYYYIHPYERDTREFISDTAANEGMSNRRPTRRTVLRTAGSLGLPSIAAATASADEDDDTRASTDSPHPTATACEPTPVRQYIATVDRIVDDRHVVLLLEDDGELVDQHVASRGRLEAVGEGDVLLVVLRGEHLLAATPLPKRPGRSATEPSPQERFDELADDDPA